LRKNSQTFTQVFIESQEAAMALQTERSAGNFPGGEALSFMLNALFAAVENGVAPTAVDVGVLRR
jgi:hypothetical protein